MYQSAARPMILATAAVLLTGATVATPFPGGTAVPVPADISLRAGSINFDGWTGLFDHTSDNIGGLFTHLTTTPLPAIQQLLANQAGNIEGLLGGDFNGVLTSVGDHAKGALAAPFTTFLPTGSPDGVYSSVLQTDSGPWNYDLSFIGLPAGHDSGTVSHADLFALLANPDGATTSNFGMELLGSPLSGVLWGGFGLVASPVVQAYLDLSGGITDLFAGDFEAVGGDLLNAPANLLDAFLNGTTLPVSLLDNQTLAQIIEGVSSLGGGTPIPADEVIKLLTDANATITADTPITFGGLLSPGGSLFDALGLDVHVDADLGGGTGGTADFNLAGAPVGLLGSLIGLTQALAGGLGWDGHGNPLADAFSDLGAGSSAATDFTDLFGI